MAQQAAAEHGGSESRDEILQAAAELFMEFGYAATSIDAVAQRLGATKGRIYHHYKSKADLFIEVQIAAMNRMNHQIEPIARGPGSTVERLSAMALRHTQILLTELPMQKVAVQGLERHLLGASSAARRLRSVVKMRDEYEKMFVEVIDDGVREGVFVDVPAKLIAKPFSVPSTGPPSGTASGAFRAPRPSTTSHAPWPALRCEACSRTRLKARQARPHCSATVRADRAKART